MAEKFVKSHFLPKLNSKFHEPFIDNNLSLTVSKISFKNAGYTDRPGLEAQEIVEVPLDTSSRLGRLQSIIH